MEVVFYSLVIVGCLLFLKLVIIVWVYICRAKRIQQQQQQQQQQQGHDANLYPATPYNAGSAFVNFEETPQPVLSVSPGDTPQALLPQMMPPPYMNDDKPPAYTDIYKQHPGASTPAPGVQTHAPNTGNGGNVGNVDTGMECVATAAAAPAPGSTLPPPSALPPTPATPPRTPEEEAHHATVTPGGSIAIV